MIKKKFYVNSNILCGLLYGVLFLLVLNILSTTSYALTESEFKNVAYNYLVNLRSQTEESAITKVNNLSISNNVAQYFDNNNVGFFFWTKKISGTNYYLYFCVINKNGYSGTNTNNCIYTSGGRWWLPKDSYKLIGGRFYGDNLSYTEFSSPNPALSNETITLFGTELDIYNAVNSIAYPAGTWANDINKDGPYLSAQFTYVYNPNLQNVTVEEIPANNGQMKAISYSQVNNRTYLCIFGDYDQLDHVYMDFYRYNTSLGEWTHYKTIEPYTDYEKEEDQIRLYFSGNYYANTICMLGFMPKTRKWI